MPLTLLPWIALFAASEPSSRSPLVLDWRAPESCPSANEVVGAVTRLVSDAGTTRFAARVVIAGGSDGYSAEIHFGGGNRTLLASSCREITEAVVVLLALAIDPNAETSRPTLGSESAGALEPTTPPTPKASASPRPRPSSARASDPETAEPMPSRTSTGWQLAPFAHVLGELGMLPGASLGAQVGVRVAEWPWFVELGALGALPRRARVASNGDTGGDLYFLGGELAGCWAPRYPTQLFGCLGFEVGRLSGAGFGADTPGTGHALWLAPTTRALLGVPLGAQMAFEASLGLAVPLLRPNFGIDGAGLLHTPAALSGRLSVGVAFF